MARVHGFWHRIYVALSGERYAREIERELRFHLELERLAQSSGDATPMHAELAARRAVGNITYYREEVRRMTVLGIFDRVSQNVRYAARGIRRSPALAITVIVTLALGLGVNAAMFSLVERLYVEPPSGVAQPQNVRRLYVSDSRALPGIASVYPSFTYPHFRAMAGAVPSTVTIAGFSAPDSETMRVGNARVAIKRSNVTQDYFKLLGVHAARGRLFAPDEQHIETPVHLAVISDALWHRAFDARPSAIGATVMLDYQPYTVIGIAPPRFTGVDLDAVDVWSPANTMNSGGSGYNHLPWYESFGGSFDVLIRGATPAAATRALDVATTAYREVHLQGWRYVPTQAVVDGPIVEAAGPMLPTREVQVAKRVAGVSAIVLFVACANVINLLLLRAASRRREIALRRALGVSRTRLYEQLATESLVLASLGGVTAVGVALWSGALIRHLMLPRVHWATVAVDGRTLAFIALLSVTIGLLTGLAPALHAMRPNLVDSLKAGSREGGYQRSRTRSALVVAQTALCIVLVIGAGLFVRSLSNLESIDLGVDVARLTFVRPYFETPPSSTVALREGLARAADELRQEPGVSAVALATAGPMTGASFGWLALPGRDTLPKLPGEFGSSYVNVSPDYFAATGVRITAGRAFTASDRLGSATTSGAVVVGASMAKAFWPNEDPIGKCIIIGKPGQTCSTVVGVAADTHRYGIIEHAVMQYYMPLDTSATPNVILLSAAPAQSAEVARRANGALKRAFPGLDGAVVVRMSQVLEPQLRSWRLGATLFTGLGVLALLIAAVGVYSVASYGVSQRTHEMGIRVAIGARTSDILDLVIGEGIVLVGAGVMLGLVVAYFLGRLVSSLLFGVTTTDPSVMIVSALVLCVMALVACLIPGWRAARVDPATALRAE